jgi:type VI secretion system secreted protein Hcp
MLNQRGIPNSSEHADREGGYPARLRGNRQRDGMATTTFIKFDGIEGEATHKDHKGEVEVLSWSWGLTNSASGATGGGSGVGKATPQELRVVHRYDKASPLLAKMAASGRHVRSAMLSARKAGEGQKDFLKITMKEVFITSVAAHDDGSGASEELAMRYGSIDFSYAPQTSKGSLGTPVSFNWNVKTGKVT